MAVEPIRSVFETLRPCLKCRRDFLPPKRRDRRIANYCSFDCERADGVTYADAFYRKRRATAESEAELAPPPPRIRIVPAAARTSVRRVTVTGRVRSRFGANMVRLRKARGWTQRDLAEQVGAHRATVFCWENDLADPAASWLRRLADALAVSMDELFRGEPS